MSTYLIIAIPFTVTAVVMFLLAARQKHKAFLITGYVMMISAVVNFVIGISLH